MELLSWVFFGPAKLISLIPYAGFVIGGTLLAAQGIRTKLLGGAINKDWFRNSTALAGLVWMIFNLYELQVGAVFGKRQPSDVALFRIDLTVITPILYVLTVAAVFSAFRRRNDDTGGDTHH
jgi:cation transporter-like permease